MRLMLLLVGIAVRPRTLLLFCQLLAVFNGIASAELLTGKVISVYDGDTITLHTDARIKKIRLSGIDAPEIKQPFGIESRDALRQDVLNQPVTVDTTKQDKYGRSVGKVLIDGDDINQRQINRGLAWVYVKYLSELTAGERVKYQTSQEEAQKAKLGLWEQDTPMEPWNFRNKYLEINAK